MVAPNPLRIAEPAGPGCVDHLYLLPVGNHRPGHPGRTVAAGHESSQCPVGSGGPVGRPPTAGPFSGQIYPLYSESPRLDRPELGRHSRVPPAGAGGDVTRKVAVFAAVQDALTRGEAVGLFPEGISHSSGRLEPLRTTAFPDRGGGSRFRRGPGGTGRST